MTCRETPRGERRQQRPESGHQPYYPPQSLPSSDNIQAVIARGTLTVRANGFGERLLKPARTEKPPLNRRQP